MRFLARDRRIRDLAVLMQLADLVLAYEHRHQGLWLLILDQTYCTQQGVKTENTFSHGQKAKSGRDQRRRKKLPRRRCHCFVMGLLITPSGLRLPLYRSYYTQEYLKKLNRRRAERKRPAVPYRKQTELAVELVETAPIPPKAKVVVLGDTAFDADSLPEQALLLDCQHESGTCLSREEIAMQSLVVGFDVRSLPVCLSEAHAGKRTLLAAS